MNEPILIVGGGQCAAQAVDGLRRGGYEGPITLIADEPHLPYQRPPLSKQFLAGELPLERVIMRPQEYYTERHVHLHLDTPVARVLRDESEVELVDGERLDYQALLLATGTRARTLPVPGNDLRNVFVLRTLGDVLAIQEQLKPGKRLVVVGGGFIGLEVAATAAKLGAEVSVLEAADRLMARVLPPMLAGWFRSLHESHGVRIVTGASVQALEGDAQVRSVRCADGSFDADLVIVGIGVVPNQELAQEAGLACDDGIMVDTACRTEDSRIFAAGDCTRHPSVLYGGTLRLESVQNAVSQARVAAAGLMGQDARYDELPWFWSDQFDAKLQMAGLSAGHDHAVLRGATTDRSFSVFYLRDGALIAADVINNPREFMACRKLLANLPTVDVGRLADPEVPLADLA